MNAGHAVLVLVCAGAALLVVLPLTGLIGRSVTERSVGSAGRSAGYPTVAVVTAIGFAAMATALGPSAQLPAYLFFVAVLVVLSFVDMATKTLPRRIVHAALAGGVVLLAPIGVVMGEPHRLLWATLGALSAFVALAVLHVLASGGFGFGDVRLGAALGWYLAWQSPRYVVVGLFLAFVTSAVAGLALMAVGRAGRRTAVPFGPFLAIGAIVALMGVPSLVAAG